MSIDPKKYVTFKRDELIPHLTALGIDPAEIELMAASIELQDAVVIRKRDVFAGPALHTYAASVATTVNMLKVMGADDRINGHVQYLHDVGDYFHQQAVDADELHVELRPGHIRD